jgi:hypothetical protein
MDCCKAELQAAGGDKWGDMSYPLGGWGLRKYWETGEPLDGSKEKWKPDLKVVKHTIRCNLMKVSCRCEECEIYRMML